MRVLCLSAALSRCHCVLVGSVVVIRARLSRPHYARRMDHISLRRRVAAWATLPLFLLAAAIVVLSLFRNVLSLSLGLPGLAITAGAAWWVITEVGVRRALGVFGSVIGLAMVFVALGLVYSRPEHFMLRTAIVLAILAAPLFLGRYALIRPARSGAGGHGPSHPVLLCNPWSGGGKVERFGLVALAEELGVEVVMLDRGLDLEQLTRDAVARGADCLGMAGGDGSQALVASVAVEHDLPFVCIPAGTRNHFALDLGLDRDDPRAAMYAFRDAEERRIDYATVNDRLFLNNVSLGIYATIVQSEEYRENKVDVSRAMMTELLGRQAEMFDLEYATPDGGQIEGAFLIMVSNNPYVLGVRRDVSQRREIDGGTLGVFAVSTRTGSQAARLMTLSAMGLRNISKYWHEFTATEFEVRSHSGTAYMGVDGEALEADTPLRFRAHPLGLRMFMPKGNLHIVEQRRARRVRLADVASVALGREPRQVSR